MASVNLCKTIMPHASLKSRRNRLNHQLAYSFVIAAAMTAVLSLWVWPGLMSFDSFLAYRQSIEGVQTAIWPPMHDYLFFVSRVLTGGPGGLLVLQSFVLLFSANLIATHCVESRPASILIMLAFVGLFFLFPTLLGTVIVLWKDVAVATFALAAVAAWLSGIRAFSWLKFAAIFIFLTISVSLRYNALPLVLPFMLLMLRDPAGAQTDTRKRWSVLLGAALVMLVSYGSTLWRLPDFKRLPPVADLVGVINLWDLVGMSACEGKSLLPEGLEFGARIDDAEFNRFYDPRHLNLTFESGIWKEHVARWGVTSDAIESQWRAAVLEHTPCYIRVRNAVFREQFGLHDRQVFYPTHGAIDENPYGIRLAYVERANNLVQRIVAWSNSPLRRTYILHGLAILLAVLAVRANHWRYDLIFAMGLGVLGFIGLLYFVAPAADARYVFPSGVFSAVVILLSLVRLAQRFKEKAAVAQPSFR